MSIRVYEYEDRRARWWRRGPLTLRQNLPTVGFVHQIVERHGEDGDGTAQQHPQTVLVHVGGQKIGDASVGQLHRTHDAFATQDAFVQVVVVDVAFVEATHVEFWRKKKKKEKEQQAINNQQQ